jgi:hypothetical protein
MTTITIEDKTTANFRTGGITFVLAIPQTRLTVRELIQERVQQEVNDYNRKLPDHFRTLVQPADAEATLNGFHMAVKRPLNWQAQFDKAIEAFHGNGFIVLVDGRQAESLEDYIDIGPTTTVSFLKLVPLVGG